MTDRTREIVIRQAQAMDTVMFEVGLFKPATTTERHQVEMLPRTWDLETLIRSISWLKFQNVDGRNIYIRPKGEHALSLLDDLSSAALEKMKHAGFTPALIVETSPDNFQAWLNHGRVLPKQTSTAAARALASEFNADPGAADWRHFGRLAGFTNQKPKHRQPGGRYPFVRLVHATGQIYEMAEEFIRGVEAQMELARIEAERKRQAFLNSARPDKFHATKSIEEFRQDQRYGGDGNRIDLAYAIYALSHGVSEDEVRTAITSRDLTHKGTDKRQAEYVDRTIDKALENAQRQERAR